MKINICRLVASLCASGKLYINKYTAEVCDEYDYEKNIKNKEDYILVDTVDYEQYISICKKFYNTIRNKQCDKLFNNYLNDFKEYGSALHNFVIDYDLENDWEEFKEKELMTIAKSFCEKNNIEYYFNKEEQNNFDLDKFAEEFLNDKDRIAYYNKKYNLE